MTTPARGFRGRNPPGTSRARDHIRGSCDPFAVNWGDVRAEIKDPFTRRETFHHRRLHARVVGVGMATLMVGFFATWTMWAFHGLEKSRSMEELLECAVWTASQLLTGGSSVQTGSALGHALEVLLELWAITVVAALAASVAAFLMQKDAADRRRT